METATQSLDNSITSLQTQKANLENAKEQLKVELSGLDDVIDQVIDLVSSWYCFPGLQERPLVINLWGMTGTGKSSLVNRLSMLIGFQYAHYRFDMGEMANSPGKMNVINQLKDTAFREPEEPFIISLDEFQHARTLDENGRESIDPKERIIWQLLDDGTFEMDQGKESEHKKLQEVCDMLRDAVREGVVTRNGLIEQNKGAWENIVAKHLAFGVGGFFRFDKEEILEELQQGNPPLLPSLMVENLYQSPNHGFETVVTLERHLKSLNTKETLDLLLKLKRRAMQPNTIDCSKALVFVIGNLDEAYPMHRNSSPDIDADHLHRMASRITIIDVKEALKDRFRSEEIARLGNNHIIYPALRNQDFQAVIRKEFKRIQAQLYQKTGLPLEVDPSFEDLLFDEGVYPAQGIRPVFTTIHQLVYPLVSEVLLQCSGNVDGIESVCLQYDPPHVKALIDWEDAYANGSEDHNLETITRIQSFKLNALGEGQKDDFQAIRAVHESGHAIGTIFLQKLTPELVCSVSAASRVSGFTYVPQEYKFFSRSSLFKKVAAMLGGYAAELQVFGEDQVTSGSANDIEEATELLARMLREWGLGPLPGHFAKSGPGLNDSIRDDGELDQEIRKWLQEALSLIRQTLQEQTTLLMQMARYLCDHSRMEKTRIMDYCRKYGNGFDPWMLRENRESGFYREVVMGALEGEPL